MRHDQQQAAWKHFALAAATRKKNEGYRLTSPGKGTPQSTSNLTAKNRRKKAALESALVLNLRLRLPNWTGSDEKQREQLLRRKPIPGPPRRRWL